MYAVFEISTMRYMEKAASMKFAKEPAENTLNCGQTPFFDSCFSSGSTKASGMMARRPNPIDFILVFSLAVNTP